MFAKNDKSKANSVIYYMFLYKVSLSFSPVMSWFHLIKSYHFIFMLCVRRKSSLFLEKGNKMNINKT